MEIMFTVGRTQLLRSMSIVPECIAQAHCRATTVQNHSRIRLTHVRLCRYMSTNKSGERDDKDSIFSPGVRPWDHIFKDSEDVSQRSGSQPRRQTMTENEKKTLRDLLNQTSPHILQEQSAQKTQIAKELREITEMPILSRKFFSKAKDVAFDELQQRMSQCQSKAELLQWAKQHIFDQFEDSQKHPPKTTYPNKSSPSSLFSKAVPKLMELFRTRFADPNLALAIYKHTKNHSVASYVYGCTTPTYNEIITTAWDHFRDLKTVRMAMEEMKANSVGADRRTEVIVERIHREASENKLWLDHSPDGDQLAMADLSQISEMLMELLGVSGGTYMDEKTRARDWKLGMSTGPEINEFGVF